MLAGWRLVLELNCHPTVQEVPTSTEWSTMPEKKTRTKEPLGRPNDNGRNEEAEKLKHGETPKDQTGAPKGRNRSNAGETTS
jgi:hypothetical protein